MKIFITGTAGFVGFHLAKRMLDDGHVVAGYDGLTDYYDVDLKRRRHGILRRYPAFSATEAMLESKDQLEQAVNAFEPDIIVHLAAQAGVRYSIDHPETYISSNLIGTYNLLEVARAYQPEHLLMASTSSVYGGNTEMPFKEVDRSDFPVSLYAATKKACEAMSHSYSHLFAIPTTCFRFFTVYGPWGRPDMALFKFVTAIEKGEPIDVYGEGHMLRDFTYIDDLIEAIVRLLDKVPQKDSPASDMDSLSTVAPWRVVNIAGGQPLGLMPFIKTVEDELGRDARKKLLPMQDGDVVATFADAALLQSLIGYVPQTPIDIGVRAFVNWFRSER